MSDQKPDSEKPDTPEVLDAGITPYENAANTLFSDQYAALQNALELLYIKDNLSGRILFLKEFPFVADYVFGKKLVQFDTEGTDDREHRSALEEEAEERRLILLDTVLNVEDHSVEKGALKLDYVEQTVKSLGRDIASLIYSARIVDRFLPSEAQQQGGVVKSSGDMLPNFSENKETSVSTNPRVSQQQIEENKGLAQEAMRIAKTVEASPPSSVKAIETMDYDHSLDQPSLDAIEKDSPLVENEEKLQDRENMISAAEAPQDTFSNDKDALADLKNMKDIASDRYSETPAFANPVNTPLPENEMSRRTDIAAENGPNASALKARLDAEANEVQSPSLKVDSETKPAHAIDPMPQNNVPATRAVENTPHVAVPAFEDDNSKDFKKSKNESDKSLSQNSVEPEAPVLPASSSFETKPALPKFEILKKGFKINLKSFYVSDFIASFCQA